MDGLTIVSSSEIVESGWRPVGGGFEGGRGGRGRGKALYSPGVGGGLESGELAGVSPRPICLRCARYSVLFVKGKDWGLAWNNFYLHYRKRNIQIYSEGTANFRSMAHSQISRDPLK